MPTPGTLRPTKQLSRRRTEKYNMAVLIGHRRADTQFIQYRTKIIAAFFDLSNISLSWFSANLRAVTFRWIERK